MEGIKLEEIQDKNANEQSIAPKNTKKAKKVALDILRIFLIIVLSPLLLLYIIIKTISRAVKKSKWEKEGKRGKVLLMKSSISDIDIMEGYEFEDFLKTLFFYAGFKAETTPKSKDYGADLILTDESGEKIVVQAKRYNKTVGVKSVQEALAALSHYGAVEAYVVTNSHFSFEAETLAKDNKIRLIDREELIEMQKRVQKELEINLPKGALDQAQNQEPQSKFPYMI